MPSFLQGPTALFGRVLLCAIFALSAIGNKIPNFSGVVGYMEKAGVPAPQVALVGAIVFLLAGSASVVFGLYARLGALLLAIFLAAASYYFHDFWNLEGEARQMQNIQFMKNLSMFGAMVFIMGNGPGPWSLDNRRRVEA